MKKGLVLVFLVFAIALALPTVLILTTPAKDGVPIVGLLIFIVVDLLLWGVFCWSDCEIIKKTKNCQERGRIYCNFCFV